MRVTAAHFIAGSTDPSQFPRQRLPEIAFAGRSNVGKSSLLNTLASRHGLARVSKTPGRTQQINFFAINDQIVFVDLPGYGFAKVPVKVKDQWKQLVEAYLIDRDQLRGAVVIVDLRRGVEEDDQMLLDFLRAERIPVVVAATKIDKLAHGERQRRLRQLALHPLPGVSAVVGVAALTGEGVKELWREIAALVR